MVEMFSRSEEKYFVKYEYYIGDGDSKVFKSVTEAQPYCAVLEVKKLKCIGHVQKRMGTKEFENVNRKEASHRWKTNGWKRMLDWASYRKIIFLLRKGNQRQCNICQ